MAAGHAYRCYCSKEELDAMREEQKARKEKPRYDGRCRARTEPREGVEPVIRFRTPDEGVTVVDDMVRGKVAFQNHELDDLIIARSDGSPTYNLTVVVDDMDMGITHVVRGDDHLNNTPRQINILKALGVEPPRYGHLPMIMGPDGAKLSKRHGAVSVMQYRDEGYLPEALLNYLVRLGWAHGDQEIFGLDELVRLFDIKDVNQSASAINPDKLLWLNSITSRRWTRTTSRWNWAGTWGSWGSIPPKGRNCATWSSRSANGRVPCARWPRTACISIASSRTTTRRRRASS